MFVRMSLFGTIHLLEADFSIKHYGEIRNDRNLGNLPAVVKN